MFYIPSLLDSLKVGSLELRNRIVMPPMAFGLSNEKGEVTDRLIDHYVQRSENLGLLIVEATNVSPEGRIFNRQLNITSDESIPGFKRLVTGIHDYGTPVALQLLHGGGASTTELSGVKPIAPSPVFTPQCGKELPREMSFEDIESVIKAFINAADRARRAGFDAAEIHGAHGYLLHQFLSPLTNQRDDDYGGSLENRIRISLRIIEGVKKKLGAGFPVLYRLGAEDLLPRGLILEEGVDAGKMLVEHGVDILDVSGGFGYDLDWIKKQKGYGILIPQATAVRAGTGSPVIGVGGINTPEEADEIIRSGKVDLIAVGRAIRRDPKWASKAIETLMV